MSGAVLSGFIAFVLVGVIATLMSPPQAFKSDRKRQNARVFLLAIAAAMFITFSVGRGQKIFSIVPSFTVENIK